MSLVSIDTIIVDKSVSDEYNMHQEGDLSNESSKRLY
jgi:hypothetical protein